MKNSVNEKDEIRDWIGNFLEYKRNHAMTNSEKLINDGYKMAMRKCLESMARIEEIPISSDNKFSILRMIITAQMEYGFFDHCGND